MGDSWTRSSASRVMGTQPKGEQGGARRELHHAGGRPVVRPDNQGQRNPAQIHTRLGRGWSTSSSDRPRRIASSATRRTTVTHWTMTWLTRIPSFSRRTSGASGRHTPHRIADDSAVHSALNGGTRNQRAAAPPPHVHPLQALTVPFRGARTRDVHPCASNRHVNKRRYCHNTPLCLAYHYWLILVDGGSL